MALPITSSFQKGVTTPYQNGAILPICLLQHIRNYSNFLDNFPLTCRLWNSLLPNTLNLELNLELKLCSYTSDLNFGDKLLSIFHRYQQQSQTIVALDLTGWKRLSDNHIMPLSNYNLHSLKLSGCYGLTEHALTHLKTPSSLTRLDLSRTKIRDFGLAELTRFPLKHLDIENSYGVADDNLKTIAQLPQLTWLNLRNCTDITNTGYALLSKLPLQVLTIGCTDSITDETIAILGNCRSLTDLTMTVCPEITNLSPLKSLSLKKLNITGCSDISTLEITTYLKDRGMEGVNLKYFILRELRDLTIFGADSTKISIINRIVVNYVQ